MNNLGSTIYLRNFILSICIFFAYGCMDEYEDGRLYNHLQESIRLNTSDFKEHIGEQVILRTQSGEDQHLSQIYVTILDLNMNSKYVDLSVTVDESKGLEFKELSSQKYNKWFQDSLLDTWESKKGARKRG